VNESPKKKLCKKCKIELSEGYCPSCYPFPRVYCRGCNQPLTSAKHRLRGIGARCYKKEKENEILRNARLKREIPFVEFINRRKYSELGDMF